MSAVLAYYRTLTAACADYLRTLGVEAEKIGSPEPGQLELSDYTSFMQMHGAIQGGTMLSVEAPLACRLAELFIYDPITPEEAKSYAPEVIAEISNIIGGSALRDRPERDVLMGNPLMLVTKQAALFAKSGQTLIQRFATPYGQMSCIFIPTDKDAELARIWTTE